jgi:hypothetical protein
MITIIADFVNFISTKIDDFLKNIVVIIKWL